MAAKSFLLLQPARSEDLGFAMAECFRCIILLNILNLGVSFKEDNHSGNGSLDYNRVCYLSSGALSG
ncbi:hypothetical protein [Xylocopilactobacillus apicola]|uniref:hypothetical protein n=1 Tax=Xylocopilactobacillus apicola TaxID=2932184 RepID=UPI002952A1BD|nr:hypothetical protein [Xylocopilactobacillus apicola]